MQGGAGDDVLQGNVGDDSIAAGGGGELILAGVQLSSLTSGWISA